LYKYNMTARPPAQALHNRIALLRTERGLSRAQLADALGVNFQTVGYLERREYAPSLDLAMRIAAYFELPIELVFSRTPFPPLHTAIINDRSEATR
jgi:DNA-binding XRE family transcriptional regulator